MPDLTSFYQSGDFFFFYLNLWLPAYTVLFLGCKLPESGESVLLIRTPSGFVHREPLVFFVFLDTSTSKLFHQPLGSSLVFLGSKIESTGTGGSREMLSACRIPGLSIQK